MALTKNLTFNGLDVPAAYIRATMFQVLPPKNSRVEFQVSFYASPEFAPLYATGYTCEFDLLSESENIAQQAYAYLKTLPEFADSTDC